MTGQNGSDILNRLLQFTTQPVAHDVPEFGTVHLRRLTLGELDAMQSDSRKPVKDGDRPIPGTVRLLARFLGDDKGAPAFDLDNPAHLNALLAMPVSIAADILRAGNAINNMEEKTAEKN